MAMCEALGPMDKKSRVCLRTAIWKVGDERLCREHALARPLQLVRGDWVKYGKWIVVKVAEPASPCSRAPETECKDLSDLTVDGLPFCKHHAENFVFDKARNDPVFSRILEIRTVGGAVNAQILSPTFWDVDQNANS